ncbi:MAG: DUF3109 family protein [Salinivirgaceae bacterium]|jgi:hypothetical protein|nr:DUF3109 family protein [Salinivirgaceae bacterium]
MLQIDRALLSFDVLEKKFVCELGACKGECCVDGDSGAPLEEDETSTIEKHYSMFEKYMTPEGKKAIKKQGKWIIDSDGDKVTPLVKNKECAYTYKSNEGIVFCAIEKAFLEKEIDFQKPLSCHLYPIRITTYKDFDAVNYESNKLCIPARIQGEKLGVPLYKFVKTPLVRKYGKEWYEQLLIAVEELAK